jgi:hypothetical protein
VIGGGGGRGVADLDDAADGFLFATGLRPVEGASEDGRPGNDDASR